MKLRSTKTLVEAIYETTKNKSGSELSHAINNVVEFLHKNQLLGKSKQILRELENMIDKEENIVRAKITSASALSKKILDELEDSLKKRYKAKIIEIDNHEDEQLINGMKIEVNDEVIDLTLSHRLHQLQTHLIRN